MAARLAAAAVGVWLTAAPAVIGYGGAAKTLHRILGPIAVTVALIAISEVTRPLRWANVAVGLGLLATPLLSAGLGAGAANGAACGLALAALACVRGRARQRYGGGWRAIRDPGA